MAQLDDLMARIESQGERRQQALREGEEALEEIARLARQALDAGGYKIEIAERAQISRPTLDAILARE